MDEWSRSPQITDQVRYMITSFVCSTTPVIVIALLPDPWHTSLLPIAVLFGAYGLMFGLGLVFSVVEWLWRVCRVPLARLRGEVPVLRCPACQTVEQRTRPFYVVRVAPRMLRVHCPECHERWLDYR